MSIGDGMETDCAKPTGLLIAAKKMGKGKQERNREKEIEEGNKTKGKKSVSYLSCDPDMVNVDKN